MARKISVQIVGDASQLERTFGKLGKQLAALGAGFFTAHSVIDGLEQSVMLARESVTVQKQLAAQLRTSGIYWSQVSGEIEDANAALSKVSGFNVDQLTQSLTILVRATGDTTAALRINEIAADVARARNISLTAAATLLGKAYVGQTSALKRIGVQVPKNLSGMAALEYTSRRFAGQAKASTDNVDRFKASLHNVQVEVGTLLLPAMDEFLGKLTDSNSAMADLMTQMDKSGSSTNKFAENMGTVGSVLGTVVNFTARAAALGISAMIPDFVGQGIQAIEALRAIGQGGPARAGPHQDENALAQLKKAHGLAIQAAQIAADIKKTVDKAKGPSAEQRNTWFDALISRQLGRVQDISSLKQQNVRLRQIAAEVEARIKATKDITRRLTLQDTLLDIFRDIRANNDQLSQDQADAIQAKKDEALGWAQFAEEQAQATKTLQDDLRTAENTLALLKRQAGTGKRSLDEARAIWEQEQKIAKIKKDIRDQQKKDATESRRQGHGVFSAAGFVSSLGIGLTPAQARSLSAKLAGGFVRPLTSGAPVGFGGQTTVISGGVHLYGVQDARKLESELQRRSKARAKPRRGV